MKKASFIILNFLSVIIEYLIIYLFFKYVLGKVFLVSIIMTLLILLLMIVFVIYANITLRKTSIEDKNRPCEDELLKIVSMVSNKYKKNVKLHYVSAPQPNPAWCIGNHVYINNEYSSPDIYLPGVIAHELGHVISGISNYTFIPSLKISTLISRVFQLTIMAFVKSNKKILHAIAYFLFVPYYIINLNNIIFTYHYLRDDELYANKIACELGYGEYLRCYYGIAVKNDEDPLFRKCDFMHPSIDKMIDEINDELNVPKEYKNIYYINDLLILAYVDTVTFTIPSFIKELYHNSIIGKQLVKIKGASVTKVNSNAFRYANKLEEIHFINAKEFSTFGINNLNNLKVIKINDLNILNEIYTKYPNKAYSNAIYKELIKNSIIEE